MSLLPSQLFCWEFKIGLMFLSILSPETTGTIVCWGTIQSASVLLPGNDEIPMSGRAWFFYYGNIPSMGLQNRHDMPFSSVTSEMILVYMTLDSNTNKPFLYIRMALQWKLLGLSIITRYNFCFGYSQYMQCFTMLDWNLFLDWNLKWVSYLSLMC